MSKNKSLGSSPIAFKTEKSSMGFIPDLGVSKTKQKKRKKEQVRISVNSRKSTRKTKTKNDSEKDKENKKKIVSYYLEVDLIEKVKSVADQKDMYYSSLVTNALKTWFTDHS